MGRQANLFLVEHFQVSPGHTGYHVCGPIHQSDVCGLHEPVDSDNLKYALELSIADMVTLLRDSYFRFASHVLPPALRIPGIPSRKLYLKAGTQASK
jgi:hypothetical protein